MIGSVRTLGPRLSDRHPLVAGQPAATLLIPKAWAGPTRSGKPMVQHTSGCSARARASLCAPSQSLVELARYERRDAPLFPFVTEQPVG